MKKEEEVLNKHEQKKKLERQAADIILRLVCQYAYTRDEKEYFSDGLSVMEDAFIWLVKHGYTKGNSERIKLTDKALALLGELWVGRCAICGTVIRARNYQDFRKKFELHTKKCFKKG